MSFHFFVSFHSWPLPKTAIVHHSVSTLKLKGSAASAMPCWPSALPPKSPGGALERHIGHPSAHMLWEYHSILGTPNQRGVAIEPLHRYIPSCHTKTAKRCQNIPQLLHRLDASNHFEVRVSRFPFFSKEWLWLFLSNIIPPLLPELWWQWPNAAQRTQAWQSGQGTQGHGTQQIWREAFTAAVHTQ